MHRITFESEFYFGDIVDFASSQDRTGRGTVMDIVLSEDRTVYYIVREDDSGEWLGGIYDTPRSTPPHFHAA
jgi:hypothetical protein